MSGGIAYDYDDAGRLTQRTSGADITAYDVLGNLRSADYSPYGVIESESGRATFPTRFASGLADPGHHLIRFGARDYDPELGRWTAKDPIRFGGERLPRYIS